MIIIIETCITFRNRKLNLDYFEYNLLGYSYCYDNSSYLRKLCFYWSIIDTLYKRLQSKVA